MSSVLQVCNSCSIWTCFVSVDCVSGSFQRELNLKSNLWIDLEHDQTAITQPSSVMLRNTTHTRPQKKTKNYIIYKTVFHLDARGPSIVKSPLWRQYKCALWRQMSLDCWQLQLQWSFKRENIGVWGNHIQHWWLLIDLEALWSTQLNWHCQTDPGTETHSFRLSVLTLLPDPM